MTRCYPFEIEHSVKLCSAFADHMERVLSDQQLYRDLCAAEELCDEMGKIALRDNLEQRRIDMWNAIWGEEWEAFKETLEDPEDRNMTRGNARVS